MSRVLVSDAAEKHNRYNQHLALLLVCWLVMVSSYLFSHDDPCQSWFRFSPSSCSVSSVPTRNTVEWECTSVSSDLAYGWPWNTTFLWKLPCHGCHIYQQSSAHILNWFNFSVQFRRRRSESERHLFKSSTPSWTLVAFMRVLRTNKHPQPTRSYQLLTERSHRITDLLPARIELRGKSFLVSIMENAFTSR